VAVAPERFAARVGGVRERGVDVAARHLIARRDVGAGRFVDRARGRGPAPVGDDVERFVVDCDVAGGVLGERPRLGHDQRHRLADVAHPVARERPLQIPVEAGQRREPDRDRAAETPEVAPRQHGDHARQRERRRRIDACQSRVRHAAAHDDGVAEARTGEVADVAAAPGDEATVFRAADVAADQRAVYGAAVHPYTLVPESIRSGGDSWTCNSAARSHW
jgi:hypothetical protein